MWSSKPFTFDDYISQFEHAKSRTKHLISSADNDILLKRPAPEKWSAIECIDHLVKFGNTYYEKIDLKLEKADLPVAPNEAIFKPRFPFRGVNRFLEPPYKMKVKTVAPFHPEGTENTNSQEIVELFTAPQIHFIEQLNHCRNRTIDLSSVKVRNPVVSFIKMRLSECYALVTAHQRRHLWQAGETIKQLL